MSDDKWSSSVDISGSINAVFCHDQQCQGTVNGFLGIADTVLKAVLLADQCGNEFRGIDLTATHLLKM